MDTSFGHKIEMLIFCRLDRTFKVTAVEKLKIHEAGISVFSENLILLVRSPGALLQVSFMSWPVVRRSSVVRFLHFRPLLQNHKLD